MWKKLPKKWRIATVFIILAGVFAIWNSGKVSVKDIKNVDLTLPSPPTHPSRTRYDRYDREYIPFPKEGGLLLSNSGWTDVIRLKGTERIKVTPFDDDCFIAVMLNEDPSKIYICPPRTWVMDEEWKKANDINTSNVVTTAKASRVQYMVTNMFGLNKAKCRADYFIYKKSEAHLM